MRLCKTFKIGNRLFPGLVVEIVTVMIEQSLFSNVLGQAEAFGDAGMDCFGLVEELAVVEADVSFIHHLHVGWIVKAGIAAEEDGTAFVRIADVEAVAGPVIFAFDMDMIGGEDLEQIRADAELVFSGLADQGADEK